MPVFPSGRLFAGKDLTPDFDISLTTRAQPEKFDTTLPGNGGLNPTNAQFYAYLATLPSWSAAAVTNRAEFVAAATAIDASGPAAGVIKFAANYNGDDVTPPNRPLPSGVQPDPTTCTIYCVPSVLPGGFPEPAAIGAAFSVRAVKDSLPVIRSRSGAEVHGWSAVDHRTGGMAQYGYRWIGFRFGPRSDGGYTNYPRVTAEYRSRRITLDRCHLDGVTDETVGGTDIEQPPGFLMDGRYQASLDCWYDNFMSAQSEKQCISVINGGPYKVVGCVLMGNGECFMAGGTDPVNGTVDTTNYPRDLEFRRNFCRQQSGVNPLHPAFYQLVSLGGNARTKQTGLTGAAYNAGTRTLTLSAGAFNTSLVDASDTFRRRRVWYVTSGAGAGSHGACSTFNSTTSVTSVDTSLTTITGTIDNTSVIEIRESIQWISKNCFELKNMRRAYLEGLVLENAWMMDGQQNMIANLKSVNQDGGGPFSLTTDITWVNSLLLNCWGGLMVSAAPSPPALAAGKIHVENVLIVATPHLTFVGGSTAFSMPLQLSADTLTFRRVTAVNFQRSVVAVWDDANGDDAGTAHKLANLVFDGYVATDAPENHIHGSAIGTGFGQGVAAYNANVDTATATWKVGIANSATVTSPSTNYPSPSNPGPAFNTYYTTDAAPWVNPLYDFTDPACDYSLKPGDPLAAQSNMNVDWPTLQAAVANVRPSKSIVPYQWIGTETTVATPTQLLLSTPPAGALAGQPLPQQPVIAFADAGGSTVTSETTSVTASLVVTSGSVTPTGTLTKAAVAGLASFTDLGFTGTLGSVAHWRFTAGALVVDGPSFTVLTSLAPAQL